MPKKRLFTEGVEVQVIWSTSARLIFLTHSQTHCEIYSLHKAVQKLVTPIWIEPPFGLALSFYTPNLCIQARTLRHIDLKCQFSALTWWNSEDRSGLEQDQEPHTLSLGYCFPFFNKEGKDKENPATRGQYASRCLVEGAR